MLPMLIYNYINFDNPFTSNPLYNAPWMIDSELFMGVFAAPDPLRIFKILFWSYKSLFPVQAHPLLFIPGVYLIVKRRLLPGPSALFILFVILFHALFVCSFNGWHGGLCYGERYITAALMLFALLSVPVYMAYPRAVSTMMILSYVALLMVTAVDITWGGNMEYPFWEYIFPNFLQGRIAVNPTPMSSTPPVPAAYNIGQFLGLSGLWSLLPLVCFQGIMLYKIFHRRCEKA